MCNNCRDGARQAAGVLTRRDVEATNTSPAAPLVRFRSPAPRPSGGDGCSAWASETQCASRVRQAYLQYFLNCDS